MNTLFYFIIIYSSACFTTLNSASYSSRLDTIDIDEILKSDRLLQNYFECLMERGPCTREGSELRRIIPDALKTECNKCSNSQKQKAGKAIKYLQESKPKMYEELEKKYDPEGIYRIKLRKSLNLNIES